jgi:hypothetical protein
MFMLTISSLWQHKTIGIGNFDQDSMASLNSSSFFNNYNQNYLMQMTQVLASMANYKRR